MKRQKQTGATIIEFVVYIVVLSLLSGVTVSFLARMMHSYARVRIDKNLSQDAALIFERIFNETRHGRLIYTPTTTASQLSVRTSLNPPADETFTYVDYYLDNGVVWEKREGNAAISLTGANIVVSNFAVNRFYSGSAEGVRINLTLTTPIQNSTLSRTFSWTSSSTLRGF